MFWRSPGEETSNEPSTLTSLLEKPDVSLRELLDDDYILQEVKCGNKRLIEYLTKEEMLVELAKLCVTEPDECDNVKKKFKYCHLASEVICAGGEPLTDALTSSEQSFNVLANFVSYNDQETKKTMNPLLASFFSNVFTLLVAKHADEVLSFMQRQPSFLDNLIANLDTSAITETLFRLACGGETEAMARTMKSWLAEIGFLSKLVSQLDPSLSVDVHQNVSYLLSELIRTLRRDFVHEDDTSSETYIDPLVQQFETQAFVDSIVTRTLNGAEPSNYSESVISCGCNILLTLIQTVLNCQNPLSRVNELGKYESGYQEDEPGKAWVAWEPDVNRVTEQCLTTNLERFKQLLEDNHQQQSPMLLPMGQIDIPFGSARLAVVQLLAQLLANGLPSAHEEFVRLDLTGTLIELFFKYKWNNFLHTNVVNCFVCALYGRLVVPASAQAPAVPFCQFLEQALDSLTSAPAPAPAGGDGANGPNELEQRASPSPILKQLLVDYHLLKLLVERCQGLNENCEAIPYSGHLLRIAITTHFAMQEGPHREHMQKIFESLPEKERQEWSQFVDTQLVPYIKRCEPDQVGPPICDMDMAESKDEGNKDTAVFEQAAVLFAEYHSRKMMLDIPENFGYSTDAFTSDQEDPAHRLMEVAADIDFQVGPILESSGESEFEDMCSQRINMYNDNDDEEDLEDEKSQNKSGEWREKEIISCGESTG